MAVEGVLFYFISFFFCHVCQKSWKNPISKKTHRTRLKLKTWISALGGYSAYIPVSALGGHVTFFWSVSFLQSETGDVEFFVASALTEKKKKKKTQQGGNVYICRRQSTVLYTSYYSSSSLPGDKKVSVFHCWNWIFRIRIRCPDVVLANVWLFLSEQIFSEQFLQSQLVRRNKMTVETNSQQNQSKKLRERKTDVGFFFSRQVFTPSIGDKRHWENSGDWQ